MRLQRTTLSSLVLCLGCCIMWSLLYIPAEVTGYGEFGAMIADFNNRNSSSSYAEVSNYVSITLTDDDHPPHDKESENEKEKEKEKEKEEEKDKTKDKAPKEKKAKTKKKKKAAPVDSEAESETPEKKEQDAEADKDTDQETDKETQEKPKTEKKNKKAKKDKAAKEKKKKEKKKPEVVEEEGHEGEIVVELNSEENGVDGIAIVANNATVRNNKKKSTNSTGAMDSPKPKREKRQKQEEESEEEEEVYDPDDVRGVLHLDVRNFQEIVKGTETILVNFEKPDNNHCINFKPVFKAVAKKIGTETMRFGDVNCKKEKPICQFFGIDIVPTLLLFHDGMPVVEEHNYFPGREENEIIEYLQEMDFAGKVMEAQTTPPENEKEKKKKQKEEEENTKQTLQQQMMAAMMKQMTSDDLSDLTPEQRAKALRGMEKQKQLRERFEEKFKNRNWKWGEPPPMKEFKQVNIQDKLDKLKVGYRSKEVERNRDWGDKINRPTPLGLTLEKLAREQRRADQRAAADAGRTIGVEDLKDYSSAMPTSDRLREFKEKIKSGRDYDDLMDKSSKTYDMEDKLQRGKDMGERFRQETKTTKEYSQMDILDMLAELDAKERLRNEADKARFVRKEAPKQPLDLSEFEAKLSRAKQDREIRIDTKDDAAARLMDKVNLLNAEEKLDALLRGREKGSESLERDWEEMKERHQERQRERERLQRLEKPRDWSATMDREWKAGNEKDWMSRTSREWKTGTDRDWAADVENQISRQRDRERNREIMESKNREREQGLAALREREAERESQREMKEKMTETLLQEIRQEQLSKLQDRKDAKDYLQKRKDFSGDAKDWDELLKASERKSSDKSLDRSEEWKQNLEELRQRELERDSDRQLRDKLTQLLMKDLKQEQLNRIQERRDARQYLQKKRDLLDEVRDWDGLLKASEKKSVDSLLAERKDFSNLVGSEKETIQEITEKLAILRDRNAGQEARSQELFLRMQERKDRMNPQELLKKLEQQRYTTADELYGQELLRKADAKKLERLAMMQGNSKDEALRIQDLLARKEGLQLLGQRDTEEDRANLVRALERAAFADNFEKDISWSDPAVLQAWPSIKERREAKSLQRLNSEELLLDRMGGGMGEEDKPYRMRSHSSKASELASSSLVDSFLKTPDRLALNRKDRGPVRKNTEFSAKVTL